MSAESIGALIGTIIGVPLVAVFFFCVLIAMLFWPLLAWSATRNIRQIRIQLERLNDTLESNMSVSGPAPAPAADVSFRTPSLPRVITKTGPLGI